MFDLHGIDKLIRVIPDDGDAGIFGTGVDLDAVRREIPELSDIHIHQDDDSGEYPVQDRTFPFHQDPASPLRQKTERTFILI